MEDQYFVKQEILYIIKVPRTKNDQILFLDRICIPKLFRAQILHTFHDSLGHFATQRIFLSLPTRFYWKTMYADVHDYTQTCDLCLRSKRNYNFRSVPLNPSETPTRPWQIWHVDFKNLCRPTKKRQYRCFFAASALLVIFRS